MTAPALNTLSLLCALPISIGAIAIDDSKVDPVQAVLDETMGLGADNGCECVGYQAHEPDGQERANLTMNRLVDRKSTRLNASHGYISYVVFCLKKKMKACA